MNETSKQIANNRRLIIGFSTRLQSAMDKKSLRAVDLKNKLGTHRSHVSNWLSGRVLPNATTLVKLSEALSVSIDYLLLGREDVSHSLR